MRRRPTNRHAAPRSTSKIRILLWVALVVLVLGVWAAVVIALGGGEQGGGSDAEEANQSEQSSSEQNPEGADDGSDSEDGTAEDAGGSGERRDVDDEVLSERPGGGVPEGAVAIEDEEGRSNGQRGFVSSFVGNAYGYSGDDVQEYRSGYEGYIDTSTYYDSPGAETLGYYASLVEDGGAENAAVLKEYTILSGDVVGRQVAASELRGFTPPKLMQAEVPEAATVSKVTYAVGNRYAGANAEADAEAGAKAGAEPEKDEEFGDVAGDVEYLEQRLFIARAEGGEGWKVLAASSPQATEDPDANRPPPDAKKVGEPQGEPHGAGTGGHDH